MPVEDTILDNLAILQRKAERNGLDTMASILMSIGLSYQATRELDVEHILSAWWHSHVNHTGFRCPS